MSMTPLTTAQVPEMDEHRLTFARKLNSHILALREELRINEIILESVLQSVSSQTETTAQMSMQIHAERVESARHRPMISDEELLTRLQVTLQKPNGNDQS
jgi:hypothetical protein